MQTVLDQFVEKKACNKYYWKVSKNSVILLSGMREGLFTNTANCRRNRTRSSTNKSLEFA